MSKVKRQMKTWARIFSTHNIVKGLISLIYKESLEINFKNPSRKTDRRYEQAGVYGKRNANGF